MNKQTNTTLRIRAMVHKGYTNRDIIDKLNCKPQSVYNIRYQINKERGLGSIGSLPKPTDGIGAPPKRKYVRKTQKLASLTPESYGFGSAPVKAEGQPVAYVREPITMYEPKPTLWQRIKGWFRG
jgi:hypothetical protein